MCKIVKKINSNQYWVFFLSIYSIKDIIKFKNMQTIEFNQNFDWFGFLIQLFLITMLYLTLRKYNKIKLEQTMYKEQMDILSIINYVRNKRLFIKSFEDVEFYKIADETDEQTWERLPQGGLFKQYLLEEKEIVKKMIYSRMKNKSIDEIEKILSKYYPSKK